MKRLSEIRCRRWAAPRRGRSYSTAAHRARSRAAARRRWARRWIGAAGSTAWMLRHCRSPAAAIRSRDMTDASSVPCSKRTTVNVGFALIELMPALTVCCDRHSRGAADQQLSVACDGTHSSDRRGSTAHDALWLRCRSRVEMSCGKDVIAPKLPDLIAHRGNAAEYPGEYAAGAALGAGARRAARRVRRAALGRSPAGAAERFRI